MNFIVFEYAALKTILLDSFYFLGDSKLGILRFTDFAFI